MRGIDWDKFRRKNTLLKKKQFVRDEKEQNKIEKMIRYDTESASDKQKEYVKSILKCETEDLVGMSVNKARRIIGEYENTHPATQKQKDTIKRKRLLLESKIEELTIKQAKNIISTNELKQKSLEKKKKELVKKSKFLKNKKNKGKR